MNYYQAALKSWHSRPSCIKPWGSIRRRGEATITFTLSHNQLQSVTNSKHTHTHTYTGKTMTQMLTINKRTNYSSDLTREHGLSPISLFSQASCNQSPLYDHCIHRALQLLTFRHIIKQATHCTHKFTCTASGTHVNWLKVHMYSCRHKRDVINITSLYSTVYCRNNIKRAKQSLQFDRLMHMYAYTS